MRKNTKTFEATTKLRGEVGDGKNVPIRLSEIRGDDVAASNAVQDVKTIDADKLRRSGENASNGGNVNSRAQRGFESSRITPKTEAKPMLAGEMDKPLQDPAQLGPADIPAHNWKSKGYAKKLSKPYHKNADTNQSSLARSRKPKTIE